MTTIVCDLKQMSGDSYLTDDSTILTVTKVFRFSGGIVGVAGEYNKCIRFIGWLDSGDDVSAPDIDGSTILVLSKSGISIYEGGTPYKIDEKFCAIGSGSQGALTAMHSGLTTRKAIELVSKVDPLTGGKIKTLKL